MKPSLDLAGTLYYEVPGFPIGCGDHVKTATGLGREIGDQGGRQEVAVLAAKVRAKLG